MQGIGFIVVGLLSLAIVVLQVMWMVKLYQYSREQRDYLKKIYEESLKK